MSCDFTIGQLVEYRTWYDGEGGWFSIENQVGVVLEIVSIIDSPFGNMEEEIILYDVKVYWLADDLVETVPDLLLAPYGTEQVEFV